MFPAAPPFRTLTVDGEVPFQEAENLEVSYSLQWQMFTLGGEEEPYLLYLPAGDHTIRLTASLDDRMSRVLEDVSESVQELSALYRQVRMITGSFPDKYRDYNLIGNIPELYDIIEKNIAVCRPPTKALSPFPGKKASSPCTSTW